MKIAVISDIHSNKFYLEAVLLQIEKLCADDIYCLGDLIGYLDEPNHVIDLMKENNVHCVKGNHEKYLLGEMTYNNDREGIYRIQEQKKLLSSKNFKYIEQLPDCFEKNIEGYNFFFSHSLPGDTSSYIRSVVDLDSFDLKKYKYFCFGHTHIPLITYHYGTCVINPGSVGQPRDYTQKPSFAIINTGTIECTLYKVDLKIQDYVNRLKNMGYSESVTRLLERTP
ncbi:MAG: metallophosphatase family protein [Desulfobacteraceae bacterium]|nr:metallophosphatase family protein [Desulfobacteraceae bacterium]